MPKVQTCTTVYVAAFDSCSEDRAGEVQTYQCSKRSPVTTASLSVTTLQI